jgi:hypothetical protein
MEQNINTTKKGMPQINIDLFTKEVFVSLAVAVCCGIFYCAEEEC